MPGSSVGLVIASKAAWIAASNRLSQAATSHSLLK